MSKHRKKRKQPEPVKNRTINPRTLTQSEYIQAIRNSHVTICVGLPGTGKTFLAVSEAVRAIKAQEVRKIIISRPIVEAGESLGYLPGKLEDKAKPYLVPIFDALKEFLTYQEIAQLQNQGKLEICPLAYMRGRTFKDSFIILDEAQNATLAQMKMLLTRLGERSKIIICGDTKQSDIYTKDLAKCAKALKGVNGISFIEFTAKDIVRHSLIGIIIERLEAVEHAKPNGNGSGNGSNNRIMQQV